MICEFVQCRLRIFSVLIAFVVLGILPLYACGNFNLGLFPVIQAGSQLNVKIQDGSDLPAALTASINVDILPGTEGQGVLELRAVYLEYCVPREGQTLTGDEISRDQCVKVDETITRLPISSLRFPKAYEEACYKGRNGGDQSICRYPGGQTPLALEILSDAGTLSPSSLDWKGSSDQTAIERIDDKTISTTFKPGPCHHAKYVDLLIFVGFSDDPDTHYATRANGTTTTIYSQDNPKSKWKLVCE
jgi:hypothetical protein